MTTAIVYRNVPGKPRQYIRRVVSHRPLWTNDKNVAQRFSEHEARRWRDLSRWRTEDHPTARASEKPGDYGMEAL